MTVHCCFMCSGTFRTTFLTTGHAYVPICRPSVTQMLTHCRKLRQLIMIRLLVMACLRLMHCGWISMVV